MTKSIIIIEDDNDLRDYLKDLLLDNGYSVQTSPDGIKALGIIKKSQPDLVVLDLGLPNMSGETVCQEIRKRYPDVQIMMLTARDKTTDIVTGLNLGADDYVTKPFKAEELLARIKARMRTGGASDNKLTVGDLEFDKKTLEVKRGEKLLKLTPKELRLLEYLMINKGRVLTREMILNRVWLYSPDIETRAVDVYIGYLRKKIDASFEKKLIHSVPGYGYMIKE